MALERRCRLCTQASKINKRDLILNCKFIYFDVNTQTVIFFRFCLFLVWLLFLSNPFPNIKHHQIGAYSCYMTFYDIRYKNIYIPKTLSKESAFRLERDVTKPVAAHVATNTHREHKINGKQTETIWRKIYNRNRMFAPSFASLFMFGRLCTHAYDAQTPIHIFLICSHLSHAPDWCLQYFRKRKNEAERSISLIRSRSNALNHQPAILITINIIIIAPSF